MSRDFSHEDGFIQVCPDCELLEIDRDNWKRMFMQMYEQNSGVTDEMMWAYRNEKSK